MGHPPRCVDRGSPANRTEPNVGGLLPQGISGGPFGASPLPLRPLALCRCAVAWGSRNGGVARGPADGWAGARAIGPGSEGGPKRHLVGCPGGALGTFPPTRLPASRLGFSSLGALPGAVRGRSSPSHSNPVTRGNAFEGRQGTRPIVGCGVRGRGQGRAVRRERRGPGIGRRGQRDGGPHRSSRRHTGTSLERYIPHAGHRPPGKREGRGGSDGGSHP